MTLNNQPKSNKFQFLYAVIIITLIPLALAFNTIFLLYNGQKDMDVELNNKAEIVQLTLTRAIRNTIDDPEKLQETLNATVDSSIDIKAIELFTFEGDEEAPFTSTSEYTQNISDPTLNLLAWGNQESYSKQIEASFSPGKSERVWLVASPLYDSQNSKIGVINLYISAARIDALTNQTLMQSLVLLLITIVIVVLLLLNHFQFFEQSVYFKKLKEVDQLKDEFISIASHELKTPLTVITSYTHMLLKDPAVQQNPKTVDYAQKIIISSRRLKDLVEDMLDVSRIEQERMQFEMNNYDTRPILSDVISELLPQAVEKKIQLEYKQIDTPVYIYGDKNKLKQIYINIIGNAIKYTMQGSISIYHELAEKTVKTYVKDTGVGMSQADIEKLFQKFARIQTDETKDIPGTGLGLWLTKQLVEKMNGTIDVQSIENEGSQFMIEFPLVKK